MTETTSTRRLSRWISGLKLDEISPDALSKVRLCLADAIACAGAGAGTSPFPTLGESIRLLEGNDGPGEPWFLSWRWSLFTEAFWNASLIHAMDYDDSHKRSKTHPGAAVWPAAIAAARLSSAQISDLVAGVVAGYETTMRLANAIGVEQHRRRGWHATSTCGTVGATAAASRVMRLTTAQTASALGLGTTQAAGTWAFKEDGALGKKLHPGHAARAGVTAAVSARAGLTGSAAALEGGDGGFFSTFAPEVGRHEWESVVAEIGRPFWLPEVALKPYPCCRTAHTAVDAALAIRTSGVRARQVQTVTVRTYGLAVEQCGFNDPVNETQAAFSTPYLVACALRDGWVSIDHFTSDQVRDDELRRLQRAVRVVHEPRLDKDFPRNWPAEVDVELTNGEIVSEERSVALGDPAKPMSPEQITQKLVGSLSAWLVEDEIGQLSDELAQLPLNGDLRPLWSTLSRLRPVRAQ